MYGAIPEAATDSASRGLTVDLTPKSINAFAEEQTAYPLLPFRRYKTVRRSLAEQLFSALVRIVFASPPRTGLKKAGYALTLAAVLLQWYVAVMDIYLVWIGIPSSMDKSLRNTLFASTENVWSVAQSFTFTCACFYLFLADKHFARRQGAEEGTDVSPGYGFLPLVPPGTSLLDYMSYLQVELIASESDSGEAAGNDDSNRTDRLLVNRTAYNQVDEDGYPTRRESPIPPYEVARAGFFWKTFIGLLIAYILGTVVLTLDIKEQYFFDYWPTREDYPNMTSGEQVAFWMYFGGFFWGMYASVTFCCLFVFLCMHLVRSIAITEQKLLRNKPAPLRFNEAVAMHEHLLRFDKNMAGTLSHWFVVNIVMLVIASLTIMVSFAYHPTIRCGSRFLYWLSVSAMTLVSSIQLSYPLVAASLVSHRWDKMVIRLARSGTWLQRGTEYQNFMTYLGLCAPKAGFLVFSNVKISGGLFIRISASFAGLIGLLRALTSDVV